MTRTNQDHYHPIRGLQSVQHTTTAPLIGVGLPTHTISLIPRDSQERQTPQLPDITLR